MRALRAVDGRLVAVRHDNKKVNIAVVMRMAPCVRAEQPDLIRLKFRHQPLRRRLKQTVVERFHGFVLSRDADHWKLLSVGVNHIASLLQRHRPAVEPLLQRLQPHLEAGDLHELRDIVRDIEARIARFEQLKKA